MHAIRKYLDILTEAVIPPIVRSPAFMKWFGESKVVNPDGSPMMVHHGTLSGTMPEFKPMTHFGTADAAGARLRQFSGFMPWGWSGVDLENPNYKPYLDRLQVGNDYHIYIKNSNILPVFLSIKNPIKIKDDLSQHTPDEIARQLMKAWKFYEDMKNKHGVDEDVLDMMLTTFENHRLKSFAPITKFLQKYGYDGLIYKNLVEDRGSTSWVVFRKHQIWPAFASRPL